MRKILGSLALIIVYLAIQMTCNSAVAIQSHCNVCERICKAEVGNFKVGNNSCVCEITKEAGFSDAEAKRKCDKLGCSGYVQLSDFTIRCASCNSGICFDQ